MRLREVGSIFAEFRHQDSNCISLGIEVSGHRWFIKRSVDEASTASLVRAQTFHAAVRHPAIAPLLASVPTPGGLALLYPWYAGEVLHGVRNAKGMRWDRRLPESPSGRFRALPVREILTAYDTVLDAHLEVARRGFVAVDLYDGCFLYDFSSKELHLVDLDEYRPSPFILDAERLPGSSRFMAPEELVRGSSIEERGMVHDLGRAAFVMLDAGEDPAGWRASDELRAVAHRATAPAPSDRFPTVRDLAGAWRAARSRQGSLTIAAAERMDRVMGR